jgi:hypothetical protein
MMSTVIPLKDMLFVFNSWTLIVDSSLCADLSKSTKIELLAENRSELGHACVVQILPSRNPEIFAAAIRVIDGPDDMKEVKFVRPCLAGSEI